MRNPETTQRITFGKADRNETPIMGETPITCGSDQCFFGLRESMREKAARQILSPFSFRCLQQSENRRGLQYEREPSSLTKH